MARNTASYTFDVTDLENPPVFNFDKAVDKIRMKIDSVLEELEYDNEQPIKLFSIGKTYAHKIKRTYNLEPLDETTFTKKGI